MKNYKKILAFMSLAAAATVTFAACGETQNVPPEHTHTYSDSWQYNEQSHWHAATCEHDWMKSAEATHSFTDKKEGEETCTEGATVTRTCTCGYSYTYTTEPLGHDWQDKEGKAADCSTEGYTAYRECSRCGKVLDKNVIRQTEHNYHYEIVTEDEEGNPVDKHQQVCGFCGEVLSGSLRDHSYGTTYQHDATNHWQVCVCGKETEKAAHTFEQKKFAYDKEQHWYVCDTCGEANTTKMDHEFDPVTGECACGATQEIDNYFQYEENGNDLTVTGMVDDLGNKTEFAIPATYEGKNVTAIAAGAFLGNTAITRLVVPASIKTVGDFAFQGCTHLEEIELRGVTKLGTFDYQVFNGCTALKSITLPAAITTIGQNMFKNCKNLTSVTFQGTVTYIDTQAFYGCEKLEGLTLNGALTYIGQKAFAESGIKTLEVQMAENGRIAQGAFENCEALTTLSITGGIQYFASPILAGCTKLETLTLPFVGNYNDSAKATDTHFGYLFGKTAKGYAIPTTLKTLNVKGGSVELGAFENCGALTVNADAAVKVQTKTFTGYEGTFNWEGTLPGPTLSDVKADKQTAFVDEQVTLSYTATPNYEAPNTTTVTVTVKKGNAAAALNTDYTVEGLVYTFKTAGTYTLTVTATYNGIEKSESVTVTVDVHGPNFTAVTVVDGVEDGHCNIGSTVTFTTTCDDNGESTFTYAVKKDGAAATESTDYTLDAAQKKITFKTAGEYTVEVTASRNGKQETKSFTVVATDPNAAKPTISSFTADTENLTEGHAAIELHLNVTYAEGDSAHSTNYRVSVKEGGDTYSNADVSYYTLEGNSFRALVAGDYQITATVITAKGAYATSELTFTVKAVELDPELAQEVTLTHGWLRAATSGSVTVNYTLGESATYLGGYEVTYEKDVETAGIQAGNGNSVQLSLAEANTVHFKVVYTHKVLAEKVFTLEIPVSFVTDLAKAPVLGSDPFGGTYGELLNSLGLQLYWDVTDGAEGEQLTLAEVSFAQVESANTTNRPLIVEHVTGNDQLPWYVMVNGFTSEGGTGYETGKVAVKLTATKDGATAAATKFFDVTALHDANSATGMNAYAKKVMGDKSNDIDFDCIMKRGNRENAILTKEGIIEHRTGADWNPEDNTFCVRPEGKTNFTVEFDFTVLKRTTNENKTSFTVQYRAGSKFEDWVGYKNSFYTENDIVKAGCWEDALDGIHWGESCPPATIGSPIHVRLTHTVSDNVVEFKWEWSTNDGPYTDWLSWKNNVSTANGNIGAPVYALQFAHECGTFILTNVKLTDLG